MFVQDFLFFKLRSLSLSQKEFPHFKFENFSVKKKVHDELYSLIIYLQKKVIYKFYMLLFKFYFF